MKIQINYLDTDDKTILASHRTDDDWTAWERQQWESALEDGSACDAGAPEKWSSFELVAYDPSAPKMNRIEILTQASSIAGALWDDRQKTGTLAEQLRAAANEPQHGTDSDLTAEDRAGLLSLAATAEQEGL